MSGYLLLLRVLSSHVPVQAVVGHHFVWTLNVAIIESFVGIPTDGSENYEFCAQNGFKWEFFSYFEIAPPLTLFAHLSIFLYSSAYYVYCTTGIRTAPSTVAILSLASLQVTLEKRKGIDEYD